MFLLGRWARINNESCSVLLFSNFKVSKCCFFRMTRDRRTNWRQDLQRKNRLSIFVNLSNVTWLHGCEAPGYELRNHNSLLLQSINRRLRKEDFPLSITRKKASSVGTCYVFVFAKRQLKSFLYCISKEKTWVERFDRWVHMSPYESNKSMNRLALSTATWQRLCCTLFCGQELKVWLGMILVMFLVPATRTFQSARARQEIMEIEKRWYFWWKKFGEPVSVDIINISLCIGFYMSQLVWHGDSRWDFTFWDFDTLLLDLYGCV